MKNNIRYIHTINEKPAFFTGEFICGISYRTPIPSYDSLKTLRANERRAIKWDKDNFETPPRYKYGWAKIKVAN